MSDMPRPGIFATGAYGEALDTPAAFQPIGVIREIAGSRCEVLLDMAALSAIGAHGEAAAGAGEIGGQIKARAGSMWLIATIRSLRLDDIANRHYHAQIDFLGESEEERPGGRLRNFRRGVTRYPSPGTAVYPVTQEDLRQIYAATEQAHIEIGTIHSTRDIRGALYVDAMLGKHFALLGSTGTGKSTAAALILHRICDLAPQGHIVMVDPHGEYAAAFRSNGAIFDVSNLQMPYWLMNFEEHCEVFLTSTGAERQVDADILAKCLLAARARGRIGQGVPKLTVDAPIPYLLSDLIAVLGVEMGKLGKASSTVPFMRIKSKIEEIKSDPRYGFMFSGMLVGDTMAAFLARIFRLPGDGKPISIIDVSGVPSEITGVVVALLGRMVFDFALWSRNEPCRPVLLVCEEAHRYIPSDRDNTTSVSRVLSRIAKEGRKYGVSLGLITQRPSDLAEGVLSQCGTIIAMRLNNQRDQDFVRAAMPEGAKSFLDWLPALRNREGVICGEGVSVPIRVAFDTLEENKRPASGDPVFSILWGSAGGEAEFIERTIQKWRMQGK